MQGKEGLSFSYVLHGKSLKRGEGLVAQMGVIDFESTLSFFISDWGRHLDVYDSTVRFIDYHQEGLIGVIATVTKELPSFTVFPYEREGKFSVGVLLNASRFVAPFPDTEQVLLARAVDESASAIKEAVSLTESLYSQGAEFASSGALYTGIQNDVWNLTRRKPM